MKQTKIQSSKSTQKPHTLLKPDQKLPKPDPNAKRDQILKAFTSGIGGLGK